MADDEDDDNASDNADRGGNGRDDDDRRKHRDGAGKDDDGDSNVDDDASEEDDDKEGKDKDKDKDDGKDKDKNKKKKPSIFRKTWFRVLILIVVIVLIVGAILWWRHERKYESTDDAFVDVHIVHIAPQIAGHVTAVHIDDNQMVHAGQPLLDIDSADADSKLAQVQAQRAQAWTQYVQAQATERGAAAQAENAQRDLARYRFLQKTNALAVSQQQIDQAEAAARNAIAQRDAARAQIAGAREQIRADDALIASAQITLGYAHIAAPIDGTIAQRSVAAGNYVSQGQELLAIVPLQIWVTANFKETQLSLIRINQHVTLKVDACGKAKVRGHVQSIQRGAGQAFGILPAENATGNYVKVIQRVPVKILLDAIPKDCVLGPGMSVEPTVKVR